MDYGDYNIAKWHPANGTPDGLEPINALHIVVIADDGDGTMYAFSIWPEYRADFEAWWLFVNEGPDGEPRPGAGVFPA